MSEPTAPVSIAAKRAEAHSKRIEPQHKTVVDSDAFDKLVTRGERVSVLQAENADLRSTIESMRDCIRQREAFEDALARDLINAEVALEDARYTVDVRGTFINALGSDLAEAQSEATQAQAEAKVFAERLEEARDQIERLSEEVGRLKYRVDARDEEIEALGSWVDFDEAGCPKCEDRARAWGADLCWICARREGAY